MSKVSTEPKKRGRPRKNNEPEIYYGPGTAPSGKVHATAKQAIAHGPIHGYKYWGVHKIPSEIMKLVPDKNDIKRLEKEVRKLRANIATQSGTIFSFKKERDSIKDKAKREELRIKINKVIGEKNQNTRDVIALDDKIKYLKGLNK